MAQRPHNNNSTVRPQINPTDVNDHAPEFQNVPYHLEVNEVSALSH